MPLVTIIRHGQTNRNTGLDTEPERISNSKLNILGTFQASKLSGEFDLVLLSPLKRAIQTYATSDIKTADVRIYDMLHERRDGSTYNSLDLLEPYEETYDQVVQRAKETIRYVKGLPHKSVCIISHGTFIECFLQAMGIDIKEEEIPNCYQTTVFL